MGMSGGPVSIYRILEWTDKLKIESSNNSCKRCHRTVQTGLLWIIQAQISSEQEASLV